MSTSQRLVAWTVTALLVLGAAVIAFVFAGSPIGIGAGSSASAEPSERGSTVAQPSTAPASSASPISDEELLAALGEIEAEVIEIRGLPAVDIGPPDLITRAELRDVLLDMLERDYPAEDRERDNRFLRALGLLTPEQDIAELQLELLGDQVLGFYDRDERRMVVVSDVGLDVLAKISYAHEYTHALQDAAFDLSFLDEEVVEDDDPYLARLTLVEGDATLTMLAWAFANLSPAELQEYAVGAELPDTSGIPSWMVSQLTFAYETGLTFTSALAGDPFMPSFDAVDAAYDDLPDSTEQVIDPSLEAWRAREEPVAVEPIDLPAILGDGWTEVDTTTLGQAMIRIVLGYLGSSSEAAVAASDGWGGDRITVAYESDDRFVAAWRTSWDSVTDAREFATAYGEAAADIGFEVRVLEPERTEVVVLHATSGDLLDRVAQTLP